MLLRSSILFPLLVHTSLVSAAATRGYGYHHGHRNHPHPSRSGSVFPFWTWLRDSAVNIVFGVPPARVERYPPSKLGHNHYEDELVLRFNISTVDEEHAFAKATERLMLDIWSWDGTEVDVRIERERIETLLVWLPSTLHTQYMVLNEHLVSAVYATYPTPLSPKEQSQCERKVSVDLWNPESSGHGDEGLYFFREYQPHKVVMRWMRLVEAMFPSFVRFITIGQSYEGREIPALVVGPGDSLDLEKPRKTLVVMGGSHAREWISTTTVNYLAWSFVASYGKDPLITKLLQTFNIVFIPELNPDGIEYTWTVDRLWRKSRQRTSMRLCPGLDLDHAFGYGWDPTKAGYWGNPCSETFGGDEPWESVEVSAFRDWAKNEVENNNVDFVGLVDLHSYSQQILFPYSYTCSVEPPNLERMEELALGLAKSIRLFSGETYSVKPACQGVLPDTAVLDQTARIESGGGSAIDWFYHEMGAHYSYQIKLRDTGSYGFLLPSDYIIPTGEEILQSMKYLGDFLLGNDGIENMEEVGESAESDEELLAIPEEYEEVMELKRQRRKR